MAKLLPPLNALEIEDKERLPALILLTKTGHERLGSTPPIQGPLIKLQGLGGHDLPQLVHPDQEYRLDKAVALPRSPDKPPDAQFHVNPLIWAANMEHPSLHLKTAHPRGGRRLRQWPPWLVWWLIKEAGVNMATGENYGNTPLHFAIFLGQEDKVRFLLGPARTRTLGTE
ncbi:hypothetical protein HOY80DRAFT_1063597 [Tuber brumale]|nr:hypothetical protein HOY80DRAFT_1063597 [Tuber brumale]